MGSHSSFFRLIVKTSDMEERKSTFESLVADLSRQETRHLLERINASMQGVEQTERSAEDGKKEKEEAKDAISAGFAKESVLLQLWLKLISLIKSIPVESLYQKELVKRVGTSLKDVSGECIDVSKELYTAKFYEALSNLRKTQLFFVSVLEAYHSDKSMFYMLLSSFISKDLYDKLISLSTDFRKCGKDISTAKKNEILREIEKVNAELDIQVKAQMYSVAQAIEWMRTFCDFSLEKTLLKFTIQTNEPTCSIFAIQNEIELLASILASSKVIPTPMLQTLFLLQQMYTSFAHDDSSKGDIPSANISTPPSIAPASVPVNTFVTGSTYTNGANDVETDNDPAQQAIKSFLTQAIEALSYIEIFKKKVPIRKIVRYVKQDITWSPIEFRGGEDWFVYFKSAWRDFFLQKWAEWTHAIQLEENNAKMLEIVGQDTLISLETKPWQTLLPQAELVNERAIEFLKTFFAVVYPVKIAPLFKTILTEGTFYRTDNLSQFTAFATTLQGINKEIKDFENELSPESMIGSSFASIIESGTFTIKTKAQMESLIRNIEGYMKRLVDRILDSLNGMNKLLSIMLGEEKTSSYAMLTNWSSIQGSNNKKFQEEVASSYETLKLVVEIVSKISSI